MPRHQESPNLRSQSKIALAVAACLATPAAFAAAFVPGDLVVSRSVYAGNATTVNVGQPLPAGGTAIADGAYPEVFDNVNADGNFGVTAPIYLDDYAVSAAGAQRVATFAVPNIATSFSSKSELALHVSTDGQFLTLMGYRAPVNALDVSNSNTPCHVDPTNPDAQIVQRGVAQIDPYGGVQVTGVNAYSGDNGRGAVLDSANGQYFMVGNAGNGSGIEPAYIVGSTGVQAIAVGGDPDPGNGSCDQPAGQTTVVGTQWGTPGAKNGFQFGYSVVQYGYAADKSGKDDNFRGLAIFENTLYATKGSGSNGINTVFRIGKAGVLPTMADASTTAVSILPGFPTVLASASSGVTHPWGIWFADENTLYIADEGNGKLATAASDSTAGVQKWALQSDGHWHWLYTLQSGLDLGMRYAVSGLDSSRYPMTGGLRSLAGRNNGDGTVTLYAVTATLNSTAEPGADPNRLVAITDALANTTAAQASGETFAVLVTAEAGEVLRGVSFAPVDALPPTLDVSVAPNTIWPPDNKLKSITATIAVSDNLDPNPSVVLDSVTCVGCNPATDIQAQVGQDSRTFYVRATKDAVYTATYAAMDGQGNTTTTQATIVVPHDQRH